MSRDTLFTCVSIIETELDRLIDMEVNPCYVLSLEQALKELKLHLLENET